MTARERILMALEHKEADRIPIHDSPLYSAIRRWHGEGLPADVKPSEYFDFEMEYFRPDDSPRFPIKIVEENKEYITKTTPYGGLRRDHKDYSTTPEIIDYPVKTRDDWEKIKERLKPDRDRADWERSWLAATKAREQDRFIAYVPRFGYSQIEHYVHSEQLLMLIATNPEWVRDMYETDAQLIIDMYEIMKKGGFEFDGAFLACDLGYRNGLLFSPHQYDEQLRPTFRKLVHYFKGQGLPVILHSDGCVKELIPRFIEDGLTCLQPLEVKAGMDVVQLKKDFGEQLAKAYQAKQVLKAIAKLIIERMRDAFASP